MDLADKKAPALSAAVILEGVVLSQSAGKSHLLQDNIGAQSSAVVMSLRPSQQVSFAVTRVLKGAVAQDQPITVYVPSLPGQEDLTVHKEYLLFLNPQQGQSGFQIADQGRSAWRIFESGGEKRLKARDQPKRLRPAEDYPAYNAFVRDLQVQLSRVALGQE